MSTTKKNIMMPAAIFTAFLLLSFPVKSEDIEETIKYAAPTMQQTLGFIDKLAGGNFTFDQSQCIATTRRSIHTKGYEYHIPLKRVNPSPDYVRTHLECVELYIDGYEKEIRRVESNGDVEMKNKVDICAQDRESAEKLARAIRYLIGLCGGPPCEDCDPYMWQ